MTPTVSPEKKSLASMEPEYPDLKTRMLFGTNPEKKEAEGLLLMPGEYIHINIVHQ
jgi:hypothetical protein